MVDDRETRGSHGFVRTRPGPIAAPGAGPAAN
jgi:hypothetical protein